MTATEAIEKLTSARDYLIYLRSQIVASGGQLAEAMKAAAEDRRAAIEEERERCAAIVQEAREGERDGDFRSLIYAIRNP
jgi:hypothetical protein